MKEELQLSCKQEKAIKLLAAGLSHEDVAKTVGCTRKTIYNWLHAQNSGDFVVALNRKKRQLVDEMESRIDLLGLEAVERLSQLLNSKNEQVALNSAKFIFEKMQQSQKIGPLTVQDWQEAQISSGLSGYWCSLRDKCVGILFAFSFIPETTSS